MQALLGNYPEWKGAGRSEELINGHFTTSSNQKNELAKSNIEQPEPIDKLNPTEPVKARA
jgi:hypothetical protein